MPWYPKAILAVVAALTLALVLVRPVRAWAMRVDIRGLAALHLIRFVGFYFLFLYGRGELPYGFAVRGGIGDIVAAALACAILIFGKSKTVLVVWNVLGLVDILAVAGTAAPSEMLVPGSMHQLDRFPLILLPTVVVPVIIVSHGLMLWRLGKTDL